MKPASRRTSESDLRTTLEQTAREQRRTEGWLFCWVMASALLYLAIAIWLLWSAT